MGLFPDQGATREGLPQLPKGQQIMSPTATATSPKSPTSLELVNEFAVKTKNEGERTVVHSLWEDAFRVNYWRGESLARSVFVMVSGGKVEVPDKQ
jgi:hypothetical protein